MLIWKLLGDLLPSELRLECERAGISASVKDSHNFIKLSKYIMGNGYDPETFFFNTLYQADKTNPLVGMTPNKTSGPVRISSPQEKVTSAEVLASAPAKGSRPASSTTKPIQQETASRSTVFQHSDDNMKTLLELFSAMASDMKKMVSLLEVKKVKGDDSPPVDSDWDQDDSEDGFSLPYWSSNSSVDSDSSRRSRGDGNKAQVTKNHASQGSNLVASPPPLGAGSSTTLATSGRRTSRASRARSSSSSSSSGESEGGSPSFKHSGSRKKLKNQVAYVKTWEDSFGQDGDHDDLWVVIDLKMVIQ